LLIFLHVTTDGVKMYKEVIFMYNTHTSSGAMPTNTRSHT